MQTPPGIESDRSSAAAVSGWTAATTRRPPSAIIGAAVAALTSTLYIVYSAWQWRQWTVKSWDLGIFAEAMQHYARLEAPIVPIKGTGFDLLGDHFHPLLIVLAPVYALAPHAFTLLVVQAVCFGLAAGILAWAADPLIPFRPAAVIGLMLGLSWGLQSAQEAQFHEIALAVPLLSASIAGLLRRRWILAALPAAFLVFVKEDLGATVAVIGILIAVRGRRPSGIWLAVWGVVWLVVAVVVVIPLLSPDHTWTYIANAGPGSTALDPASFLSPSKGETLLLLVVATGGLILRSPLAFIAVPTLAWRLLSSNYGYWGPTWHYSAVLMPVAFGAVVEAGMLAPAVRSGWLRWWSGHPALVTAVAGAALLPTLPLWHLLDPGAWTTPARAASAQAAIDSVPRGASGETDIGLMSYLVDAHPVTWIGNRNPAPDCIVLDRISGGDPGDWAGIARVGAALHHGADYTTRFARDGYEVACRR